MNTLSSVSKQSGAKQRTGRVSDCEQTDYREGLSIA